MVFALLICLTGCQNENLKPQEELASQPIEAVESIQKQLDTFAGEEAYRQDFVKPQTAANIYIDLNGYDVKDKKVAYFSNAQANQEFIVYDASDRTIAFTGKMMKVSDDVVEKKKLCKGDFSQLTKPGEYYLQVPVIGRSYSFVIEEKHDQKLLDQVKNKWIEKVSEDLEAERENEYALLWMSLAQSLAPGNFDVSMQTDYKKKIETLISGVTEGDKIVDGLSQDEYFLLATVFSQAIAQQEENGYQAKCLNIAQMAYNCGIKDMGDNEEASSEQTEKRNVAKMMAAAALYQVTGNAVYHSVLKEEWNKEQNIKSEDDTYQLFLASYFYMTTTKSVDLTICEEMMSVFMKDCTKYLDFSSESAYGLTFIKGKQQNWQRKSIMDATKLAVADYTIVSREYRTVCKQQLHFLSYDKTVDAFSASELAATWLILSIINR